MKTYTSCILLVSTTLSICIISYYSSVQPVQNKTSIERQVFNDETSNERQVLNDETSNERQVLNEACPVEIPILIQLINSETNEKLRHNFNKLLYSIISQTNCKLKFYIICDSYGMMVVKEYVRNMKVKFKPKMVSLMFYDINDVTKKLENVIHSMQSLFVDGQSYYNKPLFVIPASLHRILDHNISRLIMLDTDLLLETDINHLFMLFQKMSSNQLMGLAREQQPVYWHALSEFPPNNNLIRDEYRKTNIKKFLANSIKLLQKLHINDPEIIIERNDEGAQNLCIALEAVFLHEFIHQGSYANSSVNLKSMFADGIHTSNDDVINIAFWELVKEVTHNDVITQLKHLVATTDVGLSRAWVRLALNDSLILSYINAILADKAQLRKFYNPNAFLMDSELPHILMELLQGIMQFQFRLNYNSSKLNTWDISPLQLAGLIETETAEQTMLDEASSLQYNVTERLKDVSQVDTAKHSKVKTANILSPPLTRENINSSTQKTISNTFDSSDSPIERIDIDSMNTNSLDNSVEVDADISTHNASQGVTLISPNQSSPKMVSNSLQNKEYNSSAKNTPSTIGNRLGGDGWSGWSSSFEEHAPIQTEVDDEAEDVKSFDSLLKTYVTNATTSEVRSSDVIDGTDVPPISVSHVATDHPAIETQPVVDDIHSPSQSDTNLQQWNFEVVPRDLSLQGEAVDQRTQSSLEQLTCIAWERGLDKQSFRCNQCAKPIGLIYGAYRVCYFDGGYYCGNCHDDEEHIIPAQVIQNWQFQKYKVSKYNKLFLMKIEEEPLFHIDEINPSLYEVILDLKEVKVLRIQLQHIKEYIQTCRQEVTEDFRRRLWPREYLSDDVHQYSLLDLVQVHNGQLAHHLRKVIAQFTKHIYKCNLCCQKGFICEYCHDKTIIYPFEIHVAAQCRGCLSVFHKKCRKDKRCPKCVRIHLRLQNSNKDIDRRLSVTQREEYINTDIL